MRVVCIYIYMYTHIRTYIYIYTHTLPTHVTSELASVEAAKAGLTPRAHGWFSSALAGQRIVMEYTSDAMQGYAGNSELNPKPISKSDPSAFRRRDVVVPKDHLACMLKSELANKPFTPSHKRMKTEAASALRLGGFSRQG